MSKRIFTNTERAILRRKRFKNMDFTVRAIQVLGFNKITTLGKLLQYSREELLELRGFWRARMNANSVNDIESELGKINLFLRK